MLAKIQGLFRLTRDCEIRYLSDGKPVAKLSLACSEKYGDKETQLFIDATIWGKQAETFNQYAGRKGNQVFIVGKIQTEQWENNGQKHSKISMTVESFDFVSNRSGNDTQSYSHDSHNVNNSQSQASAQQQSQSYQAPSQQQQSYQEPARQMPSSNEVPVIDIDEDEIPF